ncbi:MAG: alkaline shock response membrane anchor protein AmaP [Candidatus Omnitrophota bacterium]
MKFVNALIFVFYSLTILLLGIFLAAVSLEVITLENIDATAIALYNDVNLKLSTGACGVLLIIISIGTMQLVSRRIRKGKGISFKNEDGEITISFSAIEDFVKKLFRNDSNIRELRPVCSTKKRGIEVSAKVALWQDVKIPEITEKIQTVVKSKLQQIFGIEDPITVKVNVFKIVSKETRKGKEDLLEIESGIEAPYQYKD